MTAVNKRRRARGIERSRCRALRFEALELRLTLDGQSGVLAGIDPHLTLSFANDGVSIAGQTNSSQALFDSIAPTASWREQILRAFQTWAIYTNADIGVVADGGQAFGSPGPQQRDDRFGDIRVGAISMSPEVGAVSVPITKLVAGTWLGDVIFNNEFNYQTIDDIFAVAMHEAGNVFGLEDSSDPNSPLFSGGAPVVHLPTIEDIAALQQLHGARAPDLNESHRIGQVQFSDNDSALHATVLKLVESTIGDEGSAPTVVYGDIGAPSDIDVFSIVTPNEYHGSTTFELRTAGISLLMPDITILNAAGQQVAHSSSQTVGGDNLTLTIPATSPHELFNIRVAGADPGVFGIGGYSLTVKFNGINTVGQTAIDAVAGGAYRYLSQDQLAELFSPDGIEFLNQDNHSDDTAALGLELESIAGFVNGSRYTTVGSISDHSDLDYYKVQSPPAGASSANVLTVSVRSLNSGGLVPSIIVLDEDSHPLLAEIIVNGGGELMVQVLGVTPSTEYIIGVKAADTVATFKTGNYELTAIFNSSSVELQSMAQGTVGGSGGGNVHTLYVGQAQLFHFVLEAGPAATLVPTAIVLTIKDQNSAAVATFAASPGDRRSPSAVLLKPGVYTIEVIARTLDGSAPPLIDYNLLGTSISDPFVGDPADPNSNPFACTDPDLAGYFCYPGNIISPDPYLWDNFVESLQDPPPALNLTQLIDLLIGDWWSWVWQGYGVNGPPLAQNDTFTTTIGVAGGSAAATDLGSNSNVLNNDIDPEGEPTVAALAATVSHGNLTLLPDGSFNYTPDAGFVGTDSFTYVAHDFTQSSNVATVRIVVGSGLSGDYDANTTVDGTDYGAWRAAYGSVDELLADGSRNGVVDASDYVIWRKNVGGSIAGGMAVAAQSTIQTTPAVAVPVITKAESSKTSALSAEPTPTNDQFVSTKASGLTMSTLKRNEVAPSVLNRIPRLRVTNDNSLLFELHQDDTLKRRFPVTSQSEIKTHHATDTAFCEWSLNQQRTLREEFISLESEFGRWQL